MSIKLSAKLEMVITENRDIMNAILDSITEHDECVIWQTLTQIFANHKRSSTLISFCVTQEVQTTSKEYLLLRGGGSFMRVISDYAKVQGKHYLQDTLGCHVRKLAKGPCLEVDPQRVKSEKDLLENRERLFKICQHFFDIILSSVNAIPIQVRQLCRELWFRIKHKFPSARIYIIGAFFFLRFVCPAVVNPEQFGIISECSVEMRRKFTLVTKLIQNIANETQPEEKEPHMNYFSEFIKKNTARLEMFYESLVDVPTDDPYPDEKKKKISTLCIYQFIRNRQASFHSKLDMISYSALISVIDDIEKELHREEEGKLRFPFFNSLRRTSLPAEPGSPHYKLSPGLSLGLVHLPSPLCQSTTSSQFPPIPNTVAMETNINLKDVINLGAGGELKSSRRSLQRRPSVDAVISPRPSSSSLEPDLPTKHSTPEFRLPSEAHIRNFEPSKEPEKEKEKEKEPNAAPVRRVNTSNVGTPEKSRRNFMIASPTSIKIYVNSTNAGVTSPNSCSMSTSWSAVNPLINVTNGEVTEMSTDRKNLTTSSSSYPLGNNLDLDKLKIRERKGTRKKRERKKETDQVQVDNNALSDNEDNNLLDNKGSLRLTISNETLPLHHKINFTDEPALKRNLHAV
eukprot:TRINITY_DN1391_c1_g1_i1.p1 TRINITY_DN1391_c1_g1~~TRINITY_DN1391_c1_g1_i1.p1  ORF type:complete len:627 (+),score=142.28 TRINITY_DN1391_c1_g1_i1:29-1909(+)